MDTGVKTFGLIDEVAALSAKLRYAELEILRQEAADRPPGDYLFACAIEGLAVFWNGAIEVAAELLKTGPVTVERFAQHCATPVQR